MTYIKWRCTKCNDVVISNTNRHHQADYCKCGQAMCDAEEEYVRWDEFVENICGYDYNFFNELVLCMKKQEFLKFINIGDGRIYLDIADVWNIRNLENKICKSLK